MEYKPVLPAFQSCLRDESRLEGAADFIVFPENTNDAAELISRAGAVPLTVQGARTGIAGGAVPDGGLVLCTEKMNRPLGCSLDSAGLPLLRVQAGMDFEGLEHFLSRGAAPDDWLPDDKAVFETLKRRYRFAPSPTETSASLGGAFACNARGPNSLRYGSTGSCTAALSWISPGGALWEIERGRYRFDKDGCALPDGSRLAAETSLAPAGFGFLHPVEGLDLVDFLAGSEGLAGIAAELVLRLEPVPAACWAVVYFFRNSGGVLNFAEALARWRKDSPGGAHLSSAEYYDSASLELIRREARHTAALRHLPPIGVEYREALQVELEGDDSESLEAALAEQLEFFVESGGLEDDTWAAADRAEAEKYRLLRHGVPELINTEIDRIRQRLPAFYKTAADFEIPRERAAAWRGRYHRDMAEAGLRGFVFGHILEGRLHVNLLAENEDEFRRCRALLESWAAAVTEEGGILAAENGAGRLKAPLVFRFLSAERREQIQSILNQLDSRGILGGVKRFNSAWAT